MSNIATYGIHEADPLTAASNSSNQPISGFLNNRNPHTILLILVLLSCGYIAILGHEILRSVKGNRNVPVRDEWWQQKQDLLSMKRLSIKSAPSEKATAPNNITVLVVYGPADDVWQHAMAKGVADGAMSVESTSVQLKPIEAANFGDVLNANAIIIGSPVENANTHPKVQAWINEWDIQYDLSRKVGAAFVTAGGMSAGEEGTLMSLVQSLMIFQLIIVGGDAWRSAFGASAITNEPPFMHHHNDVDMFFDNVCYEGANQLIHPLFLAKARGLGSRVATITKQLSSTCL